MLLENLLLNQSILAVVYRRPGHFPEVEHFDEPLFESYISIYTTHSRQDNTHLPAVWMLVAGSFLMFNRHFTLLEAYRGRNSHY